MVNEMNFTTGQLVVSKAGRDKGSLLVVTGTQNGYVLVCDGKERPLERAKRKNPSHLEQTSQFIENDSMATNKRLRKTLKILSD